jgi:hypothetical protein
MSERAIREAVRFIRERLHFHRVEFARQVGRHLFENVYMGSVAYFTRKGPKDESIEKIARGRGVKVSANTLRACVRYHLLTSEVRSQTPVEPPDLDIWSWSGLWDLEGDPELLAEAASFVHRHAIPIDLVKTAAKVLTTYLASGGRIEDVFVHRAGPDATYRRMRRMARVVLGWLRTGPPSSPALRSEVLALCDRIEEALAGS